MTYSGIGAGPYIAIHEGFQGVRLAILSTSYRLLIWGG